MGKESVCGGGGVKFKALGKLHGFEPHIYCCKKLPYFSKPRWITHLQISQEAIDNAYLSDVRTTFACVVCFRDKSTKRAIDYTPLTPAMLDIIR